MNMARYMLFDFNHMAYRYYFGAKHLSSTVNVCGVPTVVDTTIPNYTMKEIYRASGKGSNYVAVCLEGGSPFRKQHFQGASNGGMGYKEGRGRLDDTMRQSMELTRDLMLNAKVSQYCCQGYEADDMIYSLVRRIKQADSVTPIDVITNDADLLPLVDEQVSVYMRGSKQFAQEGCPELHLYYQVTPETWNYYLRGTSAFKNYYIPYNSMLLFKLIRGDQADKIAPSVKGFGGKKYSDLMEQMIIDGVEFDKIFRYGLDFDATMGFVLSEYFSDEEVARMKWIYEGLNLREYTGSIAPIKQLGIEKINKAFGVVGITVQ